MDWLWQGVIVVVAGAGAVALAKVLFHRIPQTQGKISATEIKSIEDKIESIRRSYKSASAFYREFDNAMWMKKAPELHQVSKRNLKALKFKWVQDADFSRSWDNTNVELMKLQIVEKYLRKNDLEQLINKPTKDMYGNDQAAGRLEFIKSLQARYPRKISKYVKRWIEENDKDNEL